MTRLSHLPHDLLFQLGHLLQPCSNLHTRSLVDTRHIHNLLLAYPHVSFLSGAFSHVHTLSLLPPVALCATTWQLYPSLWTDWPAIHRILTFGNVHTLLLGSYIGRLDLFPDISMRLRKVDVQTPLAALTKCRNLRELTIRHPTRHCIASVIPPAYAPSPLTHLTLLALPHDALVDALCLITVQRRVLQHLSLSFTACSSFQPTYSHFLSYLKLLTPAMFPALSHLSLTSSTTSKRPRRLLRPFIVRMRVVLHDPFSSYVFDHSYNMRFLRARLSFIHPLLPNRAHLLSVLTTLVVDCNLHHLQYHPVELPKFIRRMPNVHTIRVRVILDHHSVKMLRMLLANMPVKTVQLPLAVFQLPFPLRRVLMRACRRLHTLVFQQPVGVAWLQTKVNVQVLRTLPTFLGALSSNVRVVYIPPLGHLSLAYRYREEINAAREALDQVEKRLVHCDVGSVRAIVDSWLHQANCADETSDWPVRMALFRIYSDEVL